MLHPRLTPIGKTPGGADSVWLAEIGPYGAFGDLRFTTRWGQAASGMFEASFTMPLPADFAHHLLRRGTQVELMCGGYRVGSPLVLAQPVRGGGLDDPWELTATGVGAEVTGESTWYAFDGTGVPTNNPQVAIDTALAVSPHPLPWAGRDVTVPNIAFGGAGADDLPFTIGGLLSGIADANGNRWGVGNDNLVRFINEPTTPTYMTTPDVSRLGVADDDFASIVRTVYVDASTGDLGYKTSTNAVTEDAYGRREYLFDATALGPISGVDAQNLGNGFLARAKGRMGWLDNLTLTSNQLLTMGGQNASLLRVAEQVGTGLMVRLHGVFDDLLAYTGATYLDLIMGQADYVDGAQDITLTPLGFVARDLSSIQEEVTAAVFAA